MGSLSDFAEIAIINHILGNGVYSSPASIYMALSTADPGEDGTGIAEPVGNGYGRQSITFNAPSNRAIVQAATVQYPVATGAWGTLTHFGLYTEASGGDFLGYGALNAPISVVAGNTPSIANGQLNISFNTGGISNYLAHAILNHLFRNNLYTVPTIYVGLATAAITDTMTGSTITEMTMTDYARQAHADWFLSTDGASYNITSAINFGVLSGTPETVEGMCLLNAGTAGEVLFYDNTVSQLIGDGHTVQIPIGDFDVSIS